MKNQSILMIQHIYLLKVQLFILNLLKSKLKIIYQQYQMKSLIAHYLVKNIQKRKNGLTSIKLINKFKLFFNHSKYFIIASKLSRSIASLLSIFKDVIFSNSSIIRT